MITNTDQGMINNNSSVNSNTLSFVQNSAIKAPAELPIGGSTAFTILRSLTNGEVFWATITDMKGSEVTITLDGGQSFTASLLNNAIYNIGDRASFMLQDNQGDSIMLKAMPVQDMVYDVSIVDRILESSGIISNSRSREMVAELMRNNMPVNKDALLDMVRELALHPEADISDAVALKRMGIEITPDNLRAYDNYRSYNGAMQNDIAALCDSLNTMLTDVKGFVRLTALMSDIQILSPENTEAAVYNNTEAAVQDNSEAMPDAAIGKENSYIVPEQSQHEQIQNQSQPIIPEQMTKEQLLLTKELSDSLLNIVENYNHNMNKTGENALTVPKSLTTAKTLEEFVDQLGRTLAELEKEPFLAKKLNGFVQKEGIQKLFSEYVKNSFTLKAAELKDNDTVKEHIARSMNRLNQLDDYARQSGNRAVADATSNMRGNMDFLNHMNQFIAAAQIPIRNIGENGEGELYVYRRKSGRENGDDAMKAFLHLDMEHLGALDIYVTLNGKNVSTNFKVADVTVLDFLEANMHILTQKLTEEGYNVSTSVKDMTDEGGFDYAQEVLMPELPVNEVKRFHFDMKA